MDSPSSVLSSPSKALNPLSPERINQQTIPNSPSASSDFLRLQRKGNRGLSDVQAKVAFLNNLSRSNSPSASGSQSSAGAAAALQRAILGREEAESALVRVSSQLSEAQSRERRISERLESLLEELQTAKERQAHERVVFEKEIRKARKEAFRAGSTVVKIQEELKHARTEAKILKDEVLSERESKEHAKQEAFERAYALAGLTEELEVLKGRLRTEEARSHAAILEAQARKMSKEHVGRISIAEGDLALIMTPAPRRPKRTAEDSYNSPLANSVDPSTTGNTPPKRQRLSDIAPRQENEETESALVQGEMIEDLEAALKHERKLRVDAHDLIEFMRLECRFKRCTCRILEERDNEIRLKESTKVEDSESHEQVEYRHHNHDATVPSEEIASEGSCDEPFGIETNGEEVGEPLITFSPATGTFRAIPSPLRASPQKQPMESSEIPQTSTNEFETELAAQPTFTSPTPKYESHLQARTSETFVQNEAYTRDVTPGSHHSPIIAEAPLDTQVQTQYHTENVADLFDMKRIPLRTEDHESSRFAHVPGTPISREEALAQIRARRGKTSTLKRSVSANEAALRASGMGVTPVRAARRIPGVQHTDPRSDGAMRTRRDLSAPVRMFR